MAGAGGSAGMIACGAAEAGAGVPAGGMASGIAGAGAGAGMADNVATCTNAGI